MDTNAIAVAAISLLTPYLATASQAAAKKAGEAAWAKTVEVHQAIKARFQKEDDASYSEAMDRFEEAPEKYAEPTLNILQETLANDTDFARIGVHICGDAYVGELDRVSALKGAEIIFDGSQMWGADGYNNELMLRARAIDNGCWLACAHWNSSGGYVALRSTALATPAGRPGG